MYCRLLITLGVILYTSWSALAGHSHGGGNASPVVPLITAVTPSSGGTAGGTKGIITGFRLANIQHVYFGSNEATFTLIGPHKIALTSIPAGTGSVPVTVRNAAGTLSPAFNSFTYADTTLVFQPAANAITGHAPFLGGIEDRNMAAHRECLGCVLPGTGGALCTTSSPGYDPAFNACQSIYEGNSYAFDSQCNSTHTMTPQIKALNDPNGAFAIDYTTIGVSCLINTAPIDNSLYNIHLSTASPPLDVVVTAGEQPRIDTRNDITGVWVSQAVTAANGGDLRSIGHGVSNFDGIERIFLGGDQTGLVPATWVGFPTGWAIASSAESFGAVPCNNVQTCTNQNNDWLGQTFNSAGYTITANNANPAIITITMLPSPLYSLMGTITVTNFSTNGGSGDTNGNVTNSTITAVGAPTTGKYTYVATGPITCGSSCTAVITPGVDNSGNINLTLSCGLVVNCNPNINFRVTGQANCPSNGVDTDFAIIFSELWARDDVDGYWQLAGVLPPPWGYAGAGSSLRGLTCITYNGGYALMAVAEGADMCAWIINPDNGDFSCDQDLTILPAPAWNQGYGIYAYDNIITINGVRLFGEGDSQGQLPGQPLPVGHPYMFTATGNSAITDAVSGFIVRSGDTSPTYKLYPDDTGIPSSPYNAFINLVGPRLPLALPGQKGAGPCGVGHTTCPMMIATRATVLSPFPSDACQFFYFGGIDPRTTSMTNTEWIMREPINMVPELNTPGNGTCNPGVTSINPSSGIVAGGDNVNIAGINLTADDVVTQVFFGATPAASFEQIGDGVTAVAPAHALGTVNISVQTAYGTSPNVAADLFTYIPTPLPAVSGLDVTSGPAAGGTTVNVSGSYFDNASSVCFGASCVTPTNVNGGSVSSLTAVSPSGTVNTTVDVTVVTPIGTSPTGTQDQFSYVPLTPVITSLNPTFGALAGGDSVTIAGQFFTGITQLLWGIQALSPCGSPPCYTFVNDTTITVTTPSRVNPRSLYVTVTTPSGTNNPNGTNNQFTYNAAPPAPVVTSISPLSGPVAGGTTVTVNGTGFFNGGGSSAVSEIDFTPVGTTAVVPCDSITTFCGTSVSCSTDLLCTVHSPAGTGTQDIQVTTPAATSTANPSDQYTFNAAAGVPHVAGVNPNTGGTAGGVNCLINTSTSCTVIITGSGFQASGGVTGATGVKFGTTNATSYVVNTDSKITAVFPPGTPGVTVDVLVKNGAGTSSVVAADQFTFQDWVQSYIACTDIACTKDNQSQPLGGTELRVVITNGTPVKRSTFGGANGGIIPGTYATQCGGGPCYCLTTSWDYSPVTGKCEAVLAGTGTWFETSCVTGDGEQIIANTTGGTGAGTGGWNEDVLLSPLCGTTFYVTNMLIDGFFTWDKTGNSTNGGKVWNPPIEVAVADGVDPPIRARNWNTGNWTSTTLPGGTGTARAAMVHTDYSAPAGDCAGKPCSYLLVGNEGGNQHLTFDPRVSTWGLTANGVVEPWTAPSGPTSCAVNINVCTNKAVDWAGQTMPPTTGPDAKPITFTIGAQTPPNITVHWTGDWGVGPRGTIGISGFAVGTGGSGAGNVNGTGMPILSSTATSATFAATGPVVCGTGAGCHGTILIDVTGMRQSPSSQKDGCPGNGQDEFVWCENFRVTGMVDCPDSAGVWHAFEISQMEMYERVDGTTPYWKVMPNHTGVIPAPYANHSTAASGMRGLHCVPFGTGYALIATESVFMWRFDPNGVLAPVLEKVLSIGWTGCGICAYNNMIGVNNSTVFGEGDSGGSTASGHPFENHNPNGGYHAISGIITRANATNYVLNPPGDPTPGGQFSKLLTTNAGRRQNSQCTWPNCTPATVDGKSNAAGSPIWQGSCTGSPLLCPSMISTRTVVLSTLPHDGTTHCDFNVLSNGDPGNDRQCDGSVLYFGGHDNNGDHYHNTAWLDIVNLSTIGGVP